MCLPLLLVWDGIQPQIVAVIKERQAWRAELEKRAQVDDFYCNTGADLWKFSSGAFQKNNSDLAGGELLTCKFMDEFLDL